MIVFPVEEMGGGGMDGERKAIKFFVRKEGGKGRRGEEAMLLLLLLLRETLTDN